MKSQKGYIVNVIVTGFMAVVVLSTALYIGRFFCLTGLLEFKSPDMARADKAPSGLLGEWDTIPKGTVNEPNDVAKPSIISLKTDDDIITNFGFLEAFSPETDLEQLISSDIYRISQEYQGARHMVYFDEGLGMLVYCDIGREGIDKRGRRTGKWIKKNNWYAGPRGISQKPDAAIGRFTKPLISQNGIVFDRKLSQFVRIYFYDKEVKIGPKVQQEIVQVGVLSKNDRALGGPNWRPPQRKITKYKTRPNGKVVEYAKYEYIYIQQDTFHYYLIETRSQLDEIDSQLALDNAGMIYQLNTETLELTDPVGQLPWPGIHGSLAYEVKPLCVNGSHAGLIAGGIGPDIFRPGFLVFDEAGNQIGEEWGDIELSQFEGGPVLSITNFVLEALHAPILQLTAYFTSLRFDGADGPRSLFVLPNSLAGRRGAQLSADDPVEYILGLWVILPSLAIGILLAQRVEKDARAVGISPRAKFWWMVTTVAFGLAAYITYKMTRPTINLVTCTNCGRARRPDMDRCHQCGARWHVPELAPPLWRVIEESRPDEKQVLSSEGANQQDS